MTSKFQLVASFPHRVFTDAEASKTLQELGLCPSAQLLVERAPGAAGGGGEPRTPATTPAAAPAAANVCERLMAWVSSFLPVATAPAAAVRQQGQQPRQQPPQRQQDDSSVPSSGPVSGGEDLRRRTANQRVARFRNSMDGQLPMPLGVANGRHQSHQLCRSHLGPPCYRSRRERQEAGLQRKFPAV